MDGGPLDGSKRKGGSVDCDAAPVGVPGCESDVLYVGEGAGCIIPGVETYVGME